MPAETLPDTRPLPPEGTELPPLVSFADWYNANQATRDALLRVNDPVFGKEAQARARMAAEGSPDGVSTPGSAGEMPVVEPGLAEARDRAARYTDEKTLEGSFGLRKAVHETGTQSIRAWQGLKAKMRNGMALPGKAVKRFAYGRAKSGLQRKQGRLAQAKSVHLQQRRQGEVDKAQAKVNRRAASLHNHVTRMENRTKAVGENADRRREEYGKHLRDKREGALARKALRKELRVEGASRRETKEILAKMPAGHMERVGKLALVSETSRRIRESAERIEQKAGKRERRANERLKNMDTRIEGHRLGAQEAEATFNNIHEKLLPQARHRVEELTTRLRTMGEDGSRRAAMSAELEQAQEEVDAYTASLEYWHQVADGSRQRADKAGGRRGALQQEVLQRKGASASASGRTGAMRTVERSDQGELKEAVTVVLNPAETRKES